MAITHVDTVSGGTTATTSDAIIIPTVLPDDYLMLCCTNKGANGVPTVTDDDVTGNVWARIDGALLNRSSVWFKRATADTSGKTVTASGFTTGCAIGLSVYRGVAVDTPENLTAVFQAAGLETIAGITPSRDGSLVCLVLSHQNLNVNMTAEQCANLGALAERFDVGNTAQACQVGHASAIQSTAGPTGDFTWSTANSGHVTTVFNLLPDLVVSNANGGDPVPPRRIKRETIHPRGKTLREMFDQGRTPPAPVLLPEPAPPAADQPQTVSRETLAIDTRPLLEGLSSLREAAAAVALAQAIEEDDAEVLMVAI